MSAATWGELIWQDLERQVQEEETGQEGVWANLKETTNISNYHPTQAQGVVYRQLESQREGTYYMLNNPQAGTYVKLDAKDFYTWSLMDGTRSVKQLVVAYFSEYGSIAFGRVTDLVAQLRASSFFADPPIDLYSEVRSKSQKRTLSYWGEGAWRAFLQKEFAFSGVDRILTVLYRHVFWVFFSKPALLLYPVITVTGLALLFYTIQAGTYPLLRTDGNVVLGLLTFLVANVIMVGIHESAHEVGCQ